MTSPPAEERGLSPWGLLLVALLFTLCNVPKALVIDDAAYEAYSRHIASNPLDPYGFAVFWYDVPMEANRVLAPPVFLYYWGAVRACGLTEPWMWKLALFPWAWLLAWSVHALLVRFAPGWEQLFTVGILFSPALLPSFDLMLDIPALTLVLTGVVLFLRSSERRSFSLALLAGVVVGFAMQTKYTAFLVPPVLLLWGLVNRALIRATCVSAMGVALFVGWEVVTWKLYGESHFLVALGDGGGQLLAKLSLMPFFTSYLGGLAPVLFLMVAVSLGLPRVWRVSLVVLLVAVYVCIALLDVEFVSRAGLSRTVFGNVESNRERFQLAEVLFNSMCLAGAVAVGVMVWRLWSNPEGDSTERRKTWFLVGWLVLECAGFFGLTPFPAARRLLAVVVALSLLVARFLSISEPAEQVVRWVRGLVVAQIALALLYQGTDIWDSWQEREAVRLAREWIDGRGGGRVWFSGHWGLQFYAERAGMQPLVPEYRPRNSAIDFPEPSQLRPGDWLVLPTRRQIQQSLEYDLDGLALREVIRCGTGWPLRTIPCFYGGRVPLEHHEQALVTLRIVEVTRAMTPRRHRPRKGEDVIRPDDPIGPLMKSREPNRSGETTNPEKTKEPRKTADTMEK